jgi:hypothetical protein
MLAPATMIQPKHGTMTGRAVGYMDAMHGLCVTCHEREAREDPTHVGADLGKCARCHRGIDDGEIERIGPYASYRRNRARPVARASVDPSSGEEQRAAH